MSDELKNCPFCGKQPYCTKETQGYGPRVTCGTLSCRMSSASSFRVDDWNKRAIPAGFALVEVEKTTTILQDSWENSHELLANHIAAFGESPHPHNTFVPKCLRENISDLEKLLKYFKENTTTSTIRQDN